jgi:cold-inducible RNA-binding protein
MDVPDNRWTCRGVDLDGTAQRSIEMTANIYVGNLAFETDSAELEKLFSEHGSVSKAQVVSDRDTGRSRGFGFVEMTSQEDARKAIEAINGRDLGGRQLKVNIAKSR